MTLSAEENPGSPETDPRDFIPTGLADDDGKHPLIKTINGI